MEENENKGQILLYQQSYGSDQAGIETQLLPHKIQHNNNKTQSIQESWGIYEHHI